MNLPAEQIRVLGCLVEKDLTTPDHYPLSLNALTLACNQKSNRAPVMSLAEPEVSAALEGLRNAGLAVLAAGSVRTQKHAHNLPGKLHVDRGELSLLGALLVRGPQTLAELRARSERMHRFADPADLEAALDGLGAREPPLVMKLERRPGQKEQRYLHLLGAQERPGDSSGGPSEGARDEAGDEGTADAADPGIAERVPRLEEEVDALRGEVAALKERMRALEEALGL